MEESIRNYQQKILIMDLFKVLIQIVQITVKKNMKEVMMENTMKENITMMNIMKSKIMKVIIMVKIILKVIKLMRMIYL